MKERRKSSYPKPTLSRSRWLRTLRRLLRLSPTWTFSTAPTRLFRQSLALKNWATMYVMYCFYVANRKLLQKMSSQFQTRSVKRVIDSRGDEGNEEPVSMKKERVLMAQNGYYEHQESQQSQQQNVRQIIDRRCKEERESGVLRGAPAGYETDSESERRGRLAIPSTRVSERQERLGRCERRRWPTRHCFMAGSALMPNGVFCLMSDDSGYQSTWSNSLLKNIRKRRKRVLYHYTAMGKRKLILDFNILNMFSTIEKPVSSDLHDLLVSDAQQIMKTTIVAD